MTEATEVQDHSPMAEATEIQDNTTKRKILTYLRYIVVSIMGGLVLFIFVMAIYRKYWS